MKDIVDLGLLMASRLLIVCDERSHKTLRHHTRRTFVYLEGSFSMEVRLLTVNGNWWIVSSPCTILFYN